MKQEVFFFVVTVDTVKVKEVSGDSSGPSCGLKRAKTDDRTPMNKMTAKSLDILEFAGAVTFEWLCNDSLWEIISPMRSPRSFIVQNKEGVKIYTISWTYNISPPPLLFVYSAIKCWNINAVSWLVGTGSTSCFPKSKKIKKNQRNGPKQKKK